MVFSVKFLRAVVFVETSLLWEIYSPTCFSFYNCFIFKYINILKQKEKERKKSQSFWSVTKLPMEH